MTIGFRLKFFFQKRITPISSLVWDVKSMWRGYRKFKHVIGNGIDLQGKQHIHIFPVLKCNLNCYFCQNKFYVDKTPYFDNTYFIEWTSYLNRMYNFHHIDINGGEPLYYKYIVELLNNLENHNIVMFTNLPKDRIHLLKNIDYKKNNIQLSVSYHPLDDKREINEFVTDFKQIPKQLSPNVHVIDVPEISFKNIRTAFAKRGVYCEALDAVVPTEHNKIGNSFSTKLCKSDMDCISPDLTVYRCTGMMLRKIQGKHISEYKFSNKHESCSYYGLCGICATQKDVCDYVS